MKLPNPDRAIVSRDKIVDYLLNPAHPDNGGKADFFLRLGFHGDQWQTLAAALKVLAAKGQVCKSVESPHGNKYIIVGQIQSPNDKSALVQSIWIVDKGLDTGRLVTAYPFKE